jgi:UDP-4-amino-4,6-dideoxy-N-acetyl-beta-L-altrosamine transaminase
MSFIPYGKQTIDDDDIDAVAKVLRSDFLTTGPKIEEFENILCSFTGAKYAVAVANGTAALHLASLALLSEKDRVLTTPNSFVATANSILYAGAEPVFCDISPDGNLDLDLAEEMIKNDRSINALYVVHFSGNPVSQKKLSYLKNTYNLKILEDCAHSIGAADNGITAGSCKASDCAILSFHPVKHLTTGEGGAVTTNSKEMYDRMARLRTHGIVRDGFVDDAMAYDAKGNKNPWYYEMQELGYNYRITDIQCALGISQFKKLDSFIARRRELAQRYDRAFEKGAVRPLYTFDGRSSYHLYVARADFEKVSVTKAEFFMKMRERGIGLQLHYIPINRQPYYRELGYGSEHTPVMDEYYSECFSLPMYSSLTDAEQDYVVSSVREILNG